MVSNNPQGGDRRNGFGGHPGPQDSPLNISIYPSTQAPKNAPNSSKGPLPGSGGGSFPSTDWINKPIRDIGDVRHLLNLARRFASQLDNGAGGPYQLKMDQDILGLKKNTGANNTPHGNTQFRTGPLYEGTGFATALLTNCLALPTCLGALWLAGQSGSASAQGCLVVAVIGITNMVVNLIAKTRIDVAFKDSITKPLEQAEKERAYCDKLAWAAVVLHNLTVINPIPKVWGLEWLIRSEKTTINPVKNTEEFSVFFPLSRIRDAAAHAFKQAPNQFGKSPVQLQELASDKFFDDQLAMARQGIQDLEVRYSRLPSLMTWASIGTGAFGICSGFVGLVLGGF